MPFHTPWIVARVLLLISAGLNALPRPPGARLSRAPLINTNKHTHFLITLTLISFFMFNRSSNKTTYPGLNCDEAMRPGLRPAAAAMAAMLALVGSCAAPCSAADRLEAATITWPVPSVFTGVVCAWVTALAGSWVTESADTDCGAPGEGLSEGDEFAVVTVGTVEMVDAVLVANEPTVVPGRKTKP